MTECRLPQRVADGFKNLDALSRKEAEAVFMLYDNHAQLHDECLDPRDYADLAETLQRTRSNGLSEYALRRALISSARLLAPFSQMAATYEALGQPDVAELLRGVEATMRGVKASVPDPIPEGWKNVECDGELSLCGEELQRITNQTGQQLRRHLLQTLYAGFYDPRIGLVQSLQGSQYLNNWLAMPLLQTLWKQDPEAVIAVLDHFIAQRKLMVDNSGAGELTNTLLIVRDMMALTAEAMGRHEKFIHLDDPAVLLSLYQREGGDSALRGVGEGIAIYFNFLLKVTDTPYPDAALHKALRQWSDSTELADRVAERAKARPKDNGRSK